MGWPPLERVGAYRGVAGVSFRAFDERGVEGLPVALAALLRGQGLPPRCLSPAPLGCAWLACTPVSPPAFARLLPRRSQPRLPMPC
jgi:hypothetical protein